MPSTKTRGPKTATVVKVEAVMAEATFLVPQMTASFGSSIWALKRLIFSSTTIELSTSIPTPKANPPRDIRLKETPVKYIKTSVIIKLIGIERATIVVGPKDCKNIRITNAAKIPPLTTAPMTLSMEDLISFPWSIRMTP